MALRSRRGFFFSVIAIFLVGALLLNTELKGSSSILERSEVERARVLSMNEFLKDVESDIQRATYISGYRALLGIEEYILEYGTYVPDSGEAFQTAFINGTVGNYSPSVLKDSSLNDWKNRMCEKASELGIELKIIENQISVVQESPWTVEIYANLSIILSDRSGLASWATNKSVHTSIPVLDMEDPLFIVNSYGRISRTIKKAETLSFVSGNNTTTLLNHLNNGYYITSSHAPSFLMRLEGNLSDSPYGIESLVNVAQLSAQGIPTKQASIVDYIYFGNRTTSNLCIDNSAADPDMPAWFLLDVDDEHDKTYQITQISTSC
ncbi:MAG: hypothetical protein QXW00_01785 [Candidatus Woesearchaeota archaeon]